jgi:cytochrome c-type biogenesis protein CcmE
VARKGSPARLVIALSIAGTLAVFLLYTSIAGGGTPAVAPSELGAHAGEKVSLGGKVVGQPTGDAHDGGLRFVLRDIAGNAPDRVTVLYTGSVPDQFRSGRELVVEGRMQNGIFVAEPGSMVTKCPSKYAPEAASKTD